LARQLGFCILTKTLECRHQIKLTSYDRFFPNQDTLPKGGFGNLIALPLQREARSKGGSVFLHGDLSPVDDQWEFLRAVAKYEELSDAQWSVVEEHIPQRKKRADGKGRPARSDREILNGTIWILRTGARWCDLPEKYPLYQPCHQPPSWLALLLERKRGVRAAMSELQKYFSLDPAVLRAPIRHIPAYNRAS
jgi:transposase